MASGNAIQFDFLMGGVFDEGSPATGAKVYCFEPGTVSSFTDPNYSNVGGTYKNFYRRRIFNDDDASCLFSQGATLDADGRLNAFGSGLYDILVRNADNTETIMYVESYECDAGAGSSSELTTNFQDLARRYTLIFGGV